MAEQQPALELPGLQQPALELPGLTCTSCIAAGETCSRDIISGTPCCTGYICGASNGTDACVKMPEAVAAPMGDDDTNFTKCGCPDHEYCPGAPPPNGHCGCARAECNDGGSRGGAAAEPFDGAGQRIWAAEIIALARERDGCSAAGREGGGQKFDLRDGVIWSTVGYTSGTTPAPNYDDLGDHTEALRLEFDEDVVSYEAPEQFWDLHAEQGSRQYRSAIFYHDEAQRECAERVQAQLFPSKPDSTMTDRGGQAPPRPRRRG
ncbi:peptide-methionine (S)-S-oxide reductase [Aureococcus anophagefferens]|nr:peptide-methionine (S)-S-oxide reductase [Aureococcus anophagefferens]